MQVTKKKRSIPKKSKRNLVTILKKVPAHNIHRETTTGRAVGKELI